MTEKGRGSDGAAVETKNYDAKKEKKDGNKEGVAGARFLNVAGWSRDEMIAVAAKKRTSNGIEERAVPVETVTAEQVLAVEPMSFLEHAGIVCFLAAGVPNGVLTFPIVTFLIGQFVLGSVSLAFAGLAAVMIPLAILPQPFIPSRLQSWWAVHTLKYFSFKFICEREPIRQRRETEKIEDDANAGDDGGGDRDRKNAAAAATAAVVAETTTSRRQIFVAPPHGVFPYGNIMSMLAWPALTGHNFVGLAANSALRVPVFKQILRSIGVVDASRESARKALEAFPRSVGISTGGVAEVFETNAGDECIVLRERVGLIKLALRTGADLVPCYLFGNTKLLRCWTYERVPGLRGVMERFSRKIGFATVPFAGRWFLPIPYRVPILCVMGRPIRTAHAQTEDPTSEQIREYQDRLIDEMQDLFDRYKGLYGWSDKRLIIK